MRRYYAPFNGNRYVLNTNTGEIHDLDNEYPQCRIDDIKPEHVINCSNFEDAQLHSIFLSPYNDGCYYCLNHSHRR